MNALSMPKLKETAKLSGAVGAMTATNFLIMRKLVENGTISLPYAGFTLAAGWPLVGLWVSKKNPMMGAAIAGGSIGMTLIALAAYFTKDFSLLAMNPKQLAEMKGLGIFTKDTSANPPEMAGLPENIFFMNTGR